MVGYLRYLLLCYCYCLRDLFVDPFGTVDILFLWVMN